MFLYKTPKGYILRENRQKIKQVNGWASFDLETHVYFKNKRLNSEKELDDIFYSKKEIIKDVFYNYFEVRPWIYQVYEPLNGFIAFSTLELFLNYLQVTNITLLWDFNLKYDGEVLIYDCFKRSNKYCFFLSKDDKSFDNANRLHYFFNFSVDSTAYYFFNFWNKRHHFDVVDFANIMHSSIKLIAKGFNLDYQKGIMDYFATDWQNLKASDFDYLKNDVIILYQAVEKLEKEIKQLDPLVEKNFHDRKNLFLTAGQIAKTFLLSSIYPNLSYFQQLQKYHQDHPRHNTPNFYLKYYNLNLYRGGLTIYNPYYCGQIVNNVFSYDVNSEYPAVMLNAYDLIGSPILTEPGDPENYEKIIIFNKLLGVIKDNAFPVLRVKNVLDNAEKDFPENININYPFAIFAFEYKKLQEFYNFFEEDINRFEWYKKGNQIYKNYVLKYYDLKLKNRDQPAKRALTKILLNSAYGKLGQRIVHNNFIFTLDDCTFKQDKAHFSVDSKGGMSIINASYITARARCFLLTKIAEIGKKNIRKNVLYMDTDSCYTFCKYLKANPIKLGGMKEERHAQKALFLGPKTYILEEDGKLCLTTKGVNKIDVLRQIKDIKDFDYGKTFFAKVSKKVRGGRLIFRKWKTLINKL